MLSLGGRMTPHAIESESCIRNRKRRIVIVNTLSIPHLSPVPTILRPSTVLDHDGPTVYSFRRLELVPRCRWRILLLHDHRAVRNHLASIFVYEPIDNSRRVIDFYSWMNTVADAVNKRSGVAEFLIFTPLQSSIFSAGEKRFELCLELRQFRRKKTAGQRQSTFDSVRAR